MENVSYIPQTHSNVLCITHTIVGYTHFFLKRKLEIKDILN